MKVISDVPQQLIPDHSGGSSSEVQWFNIWILLESLSVTDVSSRAQCWPKIELLFALIGCHTKTIHAVLLAFIGSHANTIYTAQQQYQPSSILYLDALVQSIRSIKSHLQERPPLRRGYFEGRIISPPLQQQEGPSEFQKELHDEVVAFVDQIQ
ncbi:uncharacterized protein LOC144557330 isoform X2 [Carex rostrata]